jgi:hypothetical protein|tara:strand:+ start:355 stop:672 length:318 start_codon:yes stop_codon:yes gene_type:complete
MIQDKEFLKLFEECVKEIKPAVLELSKEYKTGVLMGAMLEVSLRMLMLSMGSSGALRIFAGSVANISTIGPLVDEMIRAGKGVDPLDFTQITGVKIVPDPDETIH